MTEHIDMLDPADPPSPLTAMYRQAAEWIAEVQQEFDLAPEASPEDLFAAIHDRYRGARYGFTALDPADPPSPLTELARIAHKDTTMDDWIETARQYAENADYWRERAEQCEAAALASSPAPAGLHCPGCPGWLQSPSLRHLPEDCPGLASSPAPAGLDAATCGGCAAVADGEATQCPRHPRAATRPAEDAEA